MVFEERERESRAEIVCGVMKISVQMRRIVARDNVIYSLQQTLFSLAFNTGLSVGRALLSDGRAFTLK